MNISKYTGLGNDFLITRYKQGVDYSKLAIKYCDRYMGIGADGFMVVKNDPLEMIFYNQDGSLGMMCGNGIRCFVKYCVDEGIVNTNYVEVKTAHAIQKIVINDLVDYSCSVNLGRPMCYYEKEMRELDKLDPIKIKVFDIVVEGYALLVGNNHLCVIVDDVESEVVSFLGEKLMSHEMFIDRINVNFIEVLDRNTIKVKTYERGVGWTLACGTGASSAFVVLNYLNLVDNEIVVKLKYGKLHIKYDIDKNIIMTGPASKIFKGEINE